MTTSLEFRIRNYFILILNLGGYRDAADLIHRAVRCQQHIPDLTLGQSSGKSLQDIVK